MTPERRAVYRAYQKALRDGVLIRPDKCSECGTSCTPHGHHTDYTQPLLVVWLCRGCHDSKHGRKTKPKAPAVVRRIPPTSSQNCATQRLARNLDVLRTDRRWSVEEFERRTGLTRQLLSLWRTGTNAATLPSVEKIAVKLGVDVHHLLSPDSADVLRETD